MRHTSRDWVDGYVTGLAVAAKALARAREQVSGNCDCLTLAAAWIQDMQDVTREVFSPGNPKEKSPEDIESHGR